MIVQNKKRIMFYMHYDIGNIIDEHIVYQIKAYAELGIETVFISNSTLSESELDKVRPFCRKTMLHHNKGFDFTSWKDAILAEGWDFFNDYDQLIITNCTCYGPIFPFEEMFSEMDRRDPDWWGVAERTAYLGFDNYVISSFAAFSKRVFTSEIFRKFWESIKDQYYSYWEVIRHGEMRMSMTLKKEFKYDVYCRINDIRPCKEAVHEECFYTNEAGFFLATTRCPLLKVKGFANSRDTNFSRSDEIFRLWQKYALDYPFELILKHQKRVSPLSWIRNFPDVSHIINDENSVNITNIGIFFKINQPEDILLYEQYLKNLPFEIKIAVPAELSNKLQIPAEIIPNELQNASWGKLLFEMFPEFIDSKDVLLVANIKFYPDIPEAVNLYITDYSCRAMLGTAGRINKIASMLNDSNTLALSPLPSDIVFTGKVPYLDNEDFKYLRNFAALSNIPYDRSVPTVMTNFCYITCHALKELHEKDFFRQNDDSIAKRIAYALQILSLNTVLVDCLQNLQNEYFHYHSYAVTLLRTNFKKHFSASVELAGKACVNFYHSLFPASFTHKMMYFEEPAKQFLKKLLHKK